MTERVIKPVAYTFRAVSARDVMGKPAWHGEARRSNRHRWTPVANDAGYVISYASAEAARTAAREFRDRLTAESAARGQAKKLRRKTKIL